MFTTSQQPRRLVPQWRRFLSTTPSTELEMPVRPGIAHARSYLEPELVKRIERFRQHPDLVRAADVIESAIVFGHDSEAVMAARVVLRSEAVPFVKVQAEKLMRRTGHADECLDAQADAAHQEAIAWRARTRLNPTDSIAWVELALAQLCRGHGHHAERSMTVAYQLAPTNRHVLRTAARLFFHLGDYERAHDLVRKSEATRGDPWLMAAEVALSFFAKKRPTFMKQGQALVESNSLIPSQTTELAGAVGTQMLVDGGGRLGRKLMRLSQLNPTVNAIAQAEWVARNLGGDIDVDQSAFQAQRKAWEAMAMHAFMVEGNFDKSLGCAKLWIEDEPYNPNAFAAAAVSANVAEHFATARTMAKSGLEKARGSEVLLNILAFSAANLGDLAEAETQLSKINHTENGDQSLISVANRGLVAMRRGNLSRGKALYNEAIAGFRRKKSIAFEASAISYFATELLRSGEVEEGRKRVEEAKVLNKDVKKNHIDIVIRRAERLIEAIQRGDKIPISTE